MSDPGTPGWGAIRVRGARENNLRNAGPPAELATSGEHLARRVAVPA